MHWLQRQAWERVWLSDQPDEETAPLDGEALGEEADEGRAAPPSEDADGEDAIFQDETGGGRQPGASDPQKLLSPQSRDANQC